MLWSLIRKLTRKELSASAALEHLPIGTENFRADDFAGACRQLRIALAADPGNGEVAYHLALAEAHSGRLAEAETLLKASREQRNNADVNNALANVKRLAGRLAEAADSYRHALELDPDHLPALANLGLTLRDLGEPGNALPVLDRALSIEPDHVEALLNKGLALTDLGENEKAEHFVGQALKVAPDFAQAHLQRAFTLLKRCDFSAGWREYAWRVRIPEVDRWQEWPIRLWQGETLAGKRLLVQAEQGLGDQIMFASCLPDVIASARHVMIECDPRLAKLFARSFRDAAIYRYRPSGEPDWAAQVVPDYRARFGDLPRMLRNQLSDFPRHAGYLKPDPARTNFWRSRLAALGAGLKIGISWRGGTVETGQARRSIRLDGWLPILSAKEAHFISLQYGDVTAEIKQLKNEHDIVVHSWADSDAGLDDVAALIASVDLVVTVCTTAAHLAGALGKAAWVLVPTVPEWRYLDTGSSLPWYPEVRLFRQIEPGAWDAPFASIRLALAEFSSFTVRN